MQATPATQSRGADRFTPVAPITPLIEEQERQTSWSDADWTMIDQPARASRAYQRAAYASSLTASHDPFVAQRYAQEGPSEQAPRSLHARGSEAYRAASDAGTHFQRGDMGIDLSA